MLPEDLSLTLLDQAPCRALQIRQILALLSPNLPSPSTILLHGVEATGKSLTIKAVLEAIDTPSAIVRSQECITTRHLLERTIAVVKEALAAHGHLEEAHGLDGRCENISAFRVELQHLLEGKEKFILVFNGIDRQCEAAPTLLPAIARLGEILPNLTAILITTTSHPHLLHHACIPHIHFPPYTRTETLSILSRTPLLLHASSASSQSLNTTTAANDDDTEWLWTRFIAAVWDSLGQTAARSIPDFRDVCARLWPPFIQPIVDGHYGAREFSKLLVKNRSLFQSEDALIDTIVPTTPSSTISKPKKQFSYTLPYYPTHLLISAYLASHNPPKHDITLFSKTSLSKRRKRGGGTALTSNRASKHRKVSRRLLGPHPFPLERLCAIFQAILPHTYTGGGADMMCQVATLVGLRLIVKAGMGGDVLEGGGKWRVNVGWGFVRGVARGVNFDVESYLTE
ncbi:hypothetical protein HO133_003787 [Letharia lupina]|uniref:Orc1-like AAA ATPase domain-containing protein n=1 Tax=Letharia lupina TaxID=560253 RepID=A0A8H6CAJ2_9LECA|nr:uncharacterized protein HO133_003787 [Letharia lupina]KAF6219962.1 hypothetical protein HO133_003787 [Letharia lupina]